MEILADRLVMLGEHRHQLRVVPSTLAATLLRYLPTSEEEAVFSSELGGRAYDVVDDEPVKALQEGSAQMLMKEMNVP